jgi:hypothetical protein
MLERTILCESKEIRAIFIEMKEHSQIKENTSPFAMFKKYGKLMAINAVIAI